MTPVQGGDSISPCSGRLLLAQHFSAGLLRITKRVRETDG